ncbi:MAG: aminotransferase class IV [Cyanobacteria bacterium P01_H01_bin.58]
MAAINDAASLYWYEGQLLTGETVAVSLSDPGFLYGATVFTTLRVYDRDLHHPWTAWDAHRERTQRSLQALKWCEPNWQRVEQGAIALAQNYPVLRITIFPDGRELIIGRALPTHLSNQPQQGIIAWVADDPIYRRSPSEHKTGNYLGCWLALQAAQRQDAQEAILTDVQGHWLETSTGNLWGWAEDAWWTPPLEVGILPGVLRSRLIQGLKQRDIAVIQQPWTTATVAQFTTLAHSNSVIAVRPIHTILQGAVPVNYNPDHEKIARLHAAWRSVG